MKNVYLIQICDLFGNSISLPYTVGSLWSYAQTHEIIADEYQLSALYYLRKPTNQYIDEMVDPDVVGISCYIWNWEFSKKIASQIKAKWPDCLIVFGGPQSPVNCEGFFEEHGYVDIVVHYEGEEQFSEILKENLKETPDFTTVNGCTVNLGDGNYVSSSFPPIKNIDKIPSPYTSGIFDDILTDTSLEYKATLEITRGCPYTCTFCESGTKFYTKLRQFSMERIKQEVDWFSKNKIEYVDSTDNNFGIFKRDIEIAEYFSKNKQEYGYPETYGVTWAKNHTQQIFEIAKITNEFELCRGVTLASQSIHESTLKDINRFNLSKTKLTDVIDLYKKENIPVYHELIIGLPSETYNTYIDGIGKLLDYGAQYISVHILSILPNAELGTKQQHDQHGIKIKVTKPLQSFKSYVDYDDCPEKEYLACETNTMTQAELVAAWNFSTVLSSYHFFGPTYFISRYLSDFHGVRLIDFYKKLFDYVSSDSRCLMTDEYTKVKNTFDGFFNKDQLWGMQVFGDEDIYWEYDSAQTMNLLVDMNALYAEIKMFLDASFPESMIDNDLDDVLRFNKTMINDFYNEDNKKETFNANWFEYFEKDMPLTKEQTEYTIEGNKYKDRFEYAQKLYWYGRRTGSWKATIKDDSQ